MPIVALKMLYTILAKFTLMDIKEAKVNSENILWNEIEEFVVSLDKAINDFNL